MSVTPQEARDQTAARLKASRAPKTAATGDSEGMDYLVSIPRRVFTVYLPLFVFVFVLLFPFYWMTVTTFKSNAELYNFRDFSPFLVIQPTLDNVHKLFFETSYPQWLWNTILVSTAATFTVLLGVRGLRHRAAALHGRAHHRHVDLPRLPRPRSCSSRWR